MEMDNRKLIADKLAELDQLIDQCAQRNARLSDEEGNREVLGAFSDMERELIRTRDALRAIYDDMQ